MASLRGPPVGRGRRRSAGAVRWRPAWRAPSPLQPCPQLFLQQSAPRLVEGVDLGGRAVRVLEGATLVGPLEDGPFKVDHIEARILQPVRERRGAIAHRAVGHDRGVLRDVAKLRLVRVDV